MEDFVVFLFISSIIKHVLYQMSKNIKIPKNARKIGTLKAVYIYPLKSGRGIALDEAICTDTGVIHDGIGDRQFMVMTNGEPVSGRECPTLVTIVPSIHNGVVHFDHKDLPTLIIDPSERKGTTVNIDFYGEKCTAIDCGDKAADWIKQAVNKPEAGYRLVYQPINDMYRASLGGQTVWQKECPTNAKVHFQDIFSYLILSTSSLDDLNRRVTEKYNEPFKASMQQFRPNMEIEGSEAYAEDNWQEVFIGSSSQFVPAKPCDRCRFTFADPVTGINHPKWEPTATIKQYRPLVGPYNFGPFKNIQSQSFGMLFVMMRPGVIRKGDPVYATM